MSVSVSANLNDEILKEFRDVVYNMHGLKHGSFKKTLENAMLEYIITYSKSDTARKYANEGLTVE